MNIDEYIRACNKLWKRHIYEYLFMHSSASACMTVKYSALRFTSECRNLSVLLLHDDTQESCEYISEESRPSTVWISYMILSLQHYCNWCFFGNWTVFVLYIGIKVYVTLLECIMCVRVSVYMFVCVFVCVCVSSCVCVRVCVSIHIPTRVWVRAHTFIYLCMRVHQAHPILFLLPRTAVVTEDRSRQASTLAAPKIKRDRDFWGLADQAKRHPPQSPAAAASRLVCASPPRLAASRSQTEARPLRGSGSGFL